MQKLLILFLISLIPQIGLSQTTISDSIGVKNDTITTIALIFAEHQKLSIENPLLKEKIISLEELNSLYEQSDSLKSIEINECVQLNLSKDKKIKKLTRQKKSFIIGTPLGIIISFIIGILI